MAYVSLIGLVNDSYSNRTLRVRILHIHGLPDNAISKGEDSTNRTADKDLPIIPHEIPTSTPVDDYGPGALVRIECPTGALDSAIVSRVIRTASEMANYPDSLSSLLQSIPNPDVTVTSNTTALYTGQSYVSGDTAYGADLYDPTYGSFFGYPFTSYYPVTSGYGNRTLGDGTSGFHHGVDLGAGQGTKIYSVADGTVIAAFGNWTKDCGIAGMASYGNYVTIDHGVCPIDNVHYYTHYAHMQNICVKVGDEVKGTQGGQSGTQIGIVGHTGHCYPDNENGSHLHFEVLAGAGFTSHGSAAQNPAIYISFSSGNQLIYARQLWAFGKNYSYGGRVMTDIECAAMLGNIHTESVNIDPTSVEGIYDEPFVLPTEPSSKKHPLFKSGAGGLWNYITNSGDGNMLEYTENLFARYANQGTIINKEGYKFSNGKYVAGFGLIGYTGSNAEVLLNYATNNNKNWFDFDLQVAFMMVRFGNSIHDFMSDNTTNIRDATASWAGRVEYGEGHPDYNALGIESRTSHAQYWYDKLHPMSASIATQYRGWAEDVIEMIERS